MEWYHDSSHQTTYQSWWKNNYTLLHHRLKIKVAYAWPMACDHEIECPLSCNFSVKLFKLTLVASLFFCNHIAVQFKNKKSSEFFKSTVYRERSLKNKLSQSYQYCAIYCKGVQSCIWSLAQIDLILKIYFITSNFCGGDCE